MFCSTSQRGISSNGKSTSAPTEAHVLTSNKLDLSPRDLILALNISNGQPEECRRAFQRYATTRTLPGAGDGISAAQYLSTTELAAWVRDTISQSSAVKEGQYTDGEIEEVAARFLQTYNGAGDGKLTYAEFERAVQQMGEQVDPRAYILAGVIGVAFSGFSMFFPMGPTLIQLFGMSQFQFGTLTTAFAFARLCGNIPSYVLSERFGRRPLLVGGLACISVGLGGIYFATCYEHLMLLRLAVGVGVASTFTAAGMYITDISHPLNSARSRAPMQMGMATGMLVGPALGGFLLEQYGLQQTVLVVGTGTMATALCAALVLPETSQRLKRAVNGVVGAGSAGSGSASIGVRETVAAWAPLLQDSDMRRLLAWGWFYNGAFFGAIALLPLLYVNLALTPSVVGGISTMTAAVSLVATPAVARLADRYGKLSVMVPGAALYGGCLLLVPQATSLLELLPVIAAMQVGGAMCSQGQTRAMDIVPAKDRAKVPGLWNTFGDTGTLTLSVAFASVAQYFSTGDAFYCNGSLLLLASAILLGPLVRPR